MVVHVWLGQMCEDAFLKMRVESYACVQVEIGTSVHQGGVCRQVSPSLSVQRSFRFAAASPVLLMLLLAFWELVCVWYCR